jgi:hypothetical protein
MKSLNSDICAAVQHIMALQHGRFWLYWQSHSWNMEKTIHGEGGMALKELDLDSDTADLVRAAFDKSWQFVKGDPELAHNDVEEMRALLSRHITRFARNGEKDLWRLANSAIGQLRRERSAA